MHKRLVLPVEKVLKRLVELRERQVALTPTNQESTYSPHRPTSPIRRQTGLPDPYIILAKFQGSSSGFDYADAERKIHRLLAAARHGPEADGTRRSSATGAGTEWFITRLPFIVMLADSLNLTLCMSDDLKSGVNEMLEACELPDWEIH